MNYHVVVQPRAQVDLYRIHAWIAADSASEAARWIDRLWEGILSLEEFPRRSPILREIPLRDREVRYLIVGEYFILFAIVEAKVFVPT